MQRFQSNEIVSLHEGKPNQRVATQAEHRLLVKANRKVKRAATRRSSAANNSADKEHDPLSIPGHFRRRRAPYSPREREVFATNRRWIQGQLDSKHINGKVARELSELYNHKHVGKRESQRPSADDLTPEAEAVNQQLTNTFQHIMTVHQGSHDAVPTSSYDGDVESMAFGEPDEHPMLGSRKFGRRVAAAVENGNATDDDDAGFDSDTTERGVDFSQLHIVRHKSQESSASLTSDESEGSEEEDGSYVNHVDDEEGGLAAQKGPSHSENSCYSDPLRYANGAAVDAPQGISFTAVNHYYVHSRDLQEMGGTFELGHRLM